MYIPIKTLQTALALLLLSGCSSSTPPAPEPEAKELPSTDKHKLVGGTTEEELFNNSKRLYTSGLYSVAKDSLQSLATSYPMGPYGEFAEIKLADAEFNNSDFAAAAQHYDQFISNHPSSVDTPYVLLRAARSYQLSSKGLGRDIAPLEKALVAVDKLLAQFPTSSFAASGKKLKAEVVGTLSEDERLVRDFYAKRDAQKAFEARNAVIETKWEPILKEVADTPTSEPLRAKLAISTEILSNEAPVVLAAARIGDAKITQHDKTNSLVPQADDGSVRIEKVFCQNSAVYLYLSKSFDEHDLPKSPISPKDGVLTVKLPHTTSGGATVGCFAEDDLKISSDGIVTVPAEQSASLLTLQYPPRIAILLRK